jgi:cysteinyl-tRNA synthetase
MRKLPDGASTYEKRFMMDLKSIKIKSSTVGSRSSEYIDETMKFIGKIMEKDYRYTSNSSVYFNLLKFYQEHGDSELSSYRTDNTGASSGQSATVVNDRAQMNYDGTRQPFTVIVYTNRARCFTLHYNHRKRPLTLTIRFHEI